MKVLVTMPIVKGQIYPRAMDSMFGLEWTGQLDFLFLVGGDDPKTPEHNVVNKYNVARDVVLQNGYDALLTLESDIIAPPNALKRLVATSADVAYGLYVWKNGWPYWNAYSEIKERSAVSFSRDLEWCKEAWGKVRDVAGIGNGCTLIQRHVLERFPFRKPPIAGCADWGLSLDCQEAGFTQKCDLGVICGHIQTEPLPRILWPDIAKHGFYRATDLGPIPLDLVTNGLTYLKDMEGIMKVRLLHRAHLGRGLVGGPGDIVNMTMEEAKQMIWHGIAEEVKEEEVASEEAPTLEEPMEEEIGTKRKARRKAKEDEQDKGESA